MTLACANSGGIVELRTIDVRQVRVQCPLCGAIRIVKRAQPIAQARLSEPVSFLFPEHEPRVQVGEEKHPHYRRIESQWQWCDAAGMPATPLALLGTSALRMAKPLLEQRVAWIEAETPGFLLALKVFLGPGPAAPEQSLALGESLANLRQMAEFLKAQYDEACALLALLEQSGEEKHEN
jgi:hypothetical protein